MMIVKAYDVDGTTLEKVVARRRFVATSRDGARRVVTTYDLSEMLSEQRLHREFAILGQGRGIMTSVEDEVGLFESEGVGLS